MNSSEWPENEKKYSVVDEAVDFLLDLQIAQSSRREAEEGEQVAKDLRKAIRLMHAGHGMDIVEINEAKFTDEQRVYLVVFRGECGFFLAAYIWGKESYVSMGIRRIYETQRHATELVIDTLAWPVPDPEQSAMDMDTPRIVNLDGALDVQPRRWSLARLWRWFLERRG